MAQPTNHQGIATNGQPQVGAPKNPGNVIAWIAVAGLVWLGFIIVAICLTYRLRINSDMKSALAELGTFGDFLGSLGVLFTGLGFAGIVYSFQLQVQSNKLQQEQLAHQRQDSAAQQLQADEEAARQEVAANKANYLRAIIALTQAYSQIYSNNEATYDDIYDKAKADTPDNEGDEATKRWTVKGRLLSNTDILHSIEKQLAETGDFEFPPKKPASTPQPEQTS